MCGKIIQFLGRLSFFLNFQSHLKVQSAMLIHSSLSASYLFCVRADKIITQPWLCICQ